MYVRLLRCLEHVYVVELDLTHVRGAIRKHDAGTRVEVGVAQRRRRRVLILEREHLDALPLEPLSKRVCHARAAGEAQGEPREVLELVGMATVVVHHLLRHTWLKLDTR